MTERSASFFDKVLKFLILCGELKKSFSFTRRSIYTLYAPVLYRVSITKPIDLIYDFFPKTDDLITPVYVIPTKSPVTTKPKTISANMQEKNIACDDEEECEEGSGDSGGTDDVVPYVTSSTGIYFIELCLKLHSK